MAKFRPPLWALIWLAAVLLAGVVFLADAASVNRLMDSTGLSALLYPDGRSQLPRLVSVEPEKSAGEVLEDSSVAPAPVPLAIAPEAMTTETLADSEVSFPEASLPESPAPPPGTPNTFQLYFSRLGPDSRMETASWYRELPAGTTPLTATLRALLLGPTLQEKSQGALTLLPAGTKLLSVRLKDQTALISFSEEFTRNTLGNEGLVGQLKQVIWTATQFPSVDKVQFLIAGQYRETLGEEGLSIALPVDRSSFP